MAVKKKINIISFIVKLIIALFIMTFIFVVRYFSDISQYEKKQTENVLQGKRSLEAKMRALIQEKKDVSDEKEQLNEWVDSTSEENSKLKKQCETFSRKITEQEQKIQALMSQIEEKKNLTYESFDELKSETEKKDKDIATLKAYLKEYHDDNAKLKQKIKKLKEASIGTSVVEVQPVVVSAKANENKKEAEIMETNPEYDFVVIDAGSEHGLEKGSIVFVNRGTKLIGRIVIEESEKDIAVGKPFAATNISLIKKGDKVIY
ncbi:MAG: hypothetical protein PHQ52_03295 [Candidatus Omnitrophica bacterium]|nr:hypothetical protein [Candidatus Omnitrophota bacterium]